MENKRKLRVLWQSNAPWSPSGYSQQTVDLKRLFLANGWDGSNFGMINMFGQNGGKFYDADDILNYPSIDHVMGSDAMIHHGNDFKADIIISLQDVWPLNPADLQQVPRFIPWVPVDYDPVPKPLLNNLRFANRIISMSKFGEKQLQDNGFASTYIPHGVDTNVFYPMDKKKRKIELGLDPNMFVFGMVSANKEQFNPRKSFQQVLEAFALFLQKKPNSLLYIHTDPDFPGGFPLKQLAEFLGISNHIAFPERYKQKYNTTKEDMNLIYNTFDCLLSPSSSEGFCIPVIEAQACGVPVIVNDWTSMPELIIEGETGYKVKRDDRLRIYYPIGSYLLFPDYVDLYEKMLKINGMFTEKMGQAARKWAVSQYDQTMLFQTKWLPFLENIEREIYGVENMTARIIKPEQKLKKQPKIITPKPIVDKPTTTA